MAINDTRRKVLAVLAGGLVLGVGVAVTLAAWNDSEFATGTFTAGSFNLEGSVAGDVDASYSDHNVDDGDAAATLAFDLPANIVGNMSPGDVVYEGFWVRLAAGTTTGADLVAAGTTSSPAATSNTDHLGYSIYALAPGATCNAASAVGTPIATGATLDAQAGVTTTPLLEGATATAAGTAVQLCFAVTADATLEQGLATTATWEFTATSTD
ncbi:SipW-dependent-type signal peptide-containing protein [Microbacterium sp. W4I20]|uniref:SipW-dependent-type signal peptide-containing protein n=1 Tax=Microbacterium sp. W4I20 TaxID=3042262 RepID=UPI0027823549|nr:SipW-dependent-type signal peptide-containing protein [Microbacterium sp. W4I20]MDQ0728552.1 putative ribosomally synthesized peptide with SipW-like signal peptide [Microbacterium sp. W4I20]